MKTIKRILLVVTAIVLCNIVFAFSPVSQASAQTVKFANIVNVTVDQCSGKELVISFSRPIADRLRYLSVKADSNDLTEKLSRAKFSKVFGINTKILVTVAIEKGKGAVKAVDEIMEILEKNSGGETVFIVAGEFEKAPYNCRTPELYFLKYDHWRTA